MTEAAFPKDVSDQYTRNSIRADIEESVPWVAEITKELEAIYHLGQPGDEISVTYEKDGWNQCANGTITQVNSRFGDIRFKTSDGKCYLHMNLETGDYFFSDDGRKAPDEGFSLNGITIERRD